MSRRFVFFVLRWAGIIRVWRFLHRRAITILMVHGVMDNTTSASWQPLRRQLPPSQLDRCLTQLARHYRFISLPQALEILAGRVPPQSYGVVLTFDDGYRNNFTHALPILQRHEVPATFFVVTGHVEHRRPFWFDRLDYALQQTPINGDTIRVAGQGVRLAGRTRDELRRSYQHLRDAAKTARRADAEMLDEMDRLAGRLEEAAGGRLMDIFESDPWSAVASWDDIAAAAGDPLVTIGSHTVDHLRLGLVDPAVAAEQLGKSRESIERYTGRVCRYLCYPNGCFTSQVVSLAEESGYVGAVTTMEGLNYPGENLLTLRRITFPLTSNLAETLSAISGLSFALESLAACLRRLLRPSPTTRS